MISLEDWVTIRNLHARGLSARAIAVELGISRNTVKAGLDSPGPRKYSRAPAGNPQLDPLKPQIREMFLEKGFIGTRILEELRLLGYSGSRAPVYRYLATLRPEVFWGSKVTERFETPPGHQGQFDWSEYTLPLGRVLTRIIVFCLILSFSRRKHHYVSLDQTQGSVFAAIEAGFCHFGGAPRELLVDNCRAMVLNANPRAVRFNDRFLELCGHYSVKPVACKPRRARTKDDASHYTFSPRFVTASPRQLVLPLDRRASARGFEQALPFVVVRVST